jgi:hypothetical protein
MKTVGNRNWKTMSEPTNDDYLTGYVCEFHDINDVDDIIQIANNALSNVFTGTNSSSVNGGWISTDNYNVKINSSSITFYQDDETTIITTETIQVFLELLNAWKNFLQTPPHHMQII